MDTLLSPVTYSPRPSGNATMVSGSSRTGTSIPPQVVEPSGTLPSADRIYSRAEVQANEVRHQIIPSRWRREDIVAFLLYGLISRITFSFHTLFTLFHFGLPQAFEVYIHDLQRVCETELVNLGAMQSSAADYVITSSNFEETWRRYKEWAGRMWTITAVACLVPIGGNIALLTQAKMQKQYIMEVLDVISTISSVAGILHALGMHIYLCRLRDAPSAAAWSMTLADRRQRGNTSVYWDIPVFVSIPTVFFGWSLVASSFSIIFRYTSKHTPPCDFECMGDYRTPVNLFFCVVVFMFLAHGWSVYVTLWRLYGRSRSIRQGRGHPSGA